MNNELSMTAPRHFPGLRLWGLLSAAGTVACATTVFGFLGSLSWFLDLFSHFRVQYLFGLVVLGVIFLAGRRRKTAVAFLGFAFVNLAVVLLAVAGRTRAMPEGAPVMRAMLINVNTRFGDPVRVGQAIRDADPDLLVLEEISDSWMKDLTWLTNAYPHFLAHPQEDNFGIGLFSKRPFAEARIVYMGDAGVPSILATVEMGPTNLTVLATHPLPPGGAGYSRMRNEQLGLMPGYLYPARPSILVGDLNVTPWNGYFRKLMKEAGLQDSAKGRGVQPTWPAQNILLRVPLDHFLHSPDVVVARRQVGPDVGSDHFPLIVDFAIVPAREKEKTAP
jgi:endonuclease/exonuclease/phosphatase (EEP) superfamily protein YafD